MLQEVIPSLQQSLQLCCDFALVSQACCFALVSQACCLALVSQACCFALVSQACSDPFTCNVYSLAEVCAELVLLLAAEKLESSQVKTMVDQVWQLRLTNPDPLQKLLHHDEVRFHTCFGQTCVQTYFTI